MGLGSEEDASLGLQTLNALSSFLAALTAAENDLKGFLFRDNLTLVSAMPLIKASRHISSAREGSLGHAAVAFCLRRSA